VPMLMMWLFAVTQYRNEVLSLRLVD